MSARRQRGEGGISEYSTASGPRYRIDWSVPVDPDDPDEGLRRRTRGGFTTKKLAAAALRAELTAIAEGRSTKVEDLTLGQYAEEWLEGIQIADTTRSGYAKTLRLHVLPYIGKKRVSDLRPSHLSKLYRDLENHGRADGTGGLGPNTVLKAHVLIGTVLEAAVEDHLIAKNPARSTRANPPSSRDVKRAKNEFVPWTIEQTDRFLTWSKRRHWLHPAWVVLAYTGMRRSEILGLKWGDIDFVKGRLHARRGVTLVKVHGRGERLVVGPLKNERVRTIDIDTETSDALREWRKHIARAGFQHVSAAAWVFADQDAGPRHPERFSRIWRNAVNAAQRELAIDVPNKDIEEVLPYTHMHGIRHAHASHLLEAGEQVKIVQERLGHSSPTITHNVYSHLAPTAQKEAVNRLASRRAAARNLDVDAVTEVRG